MKTVKLPKTDRIPANGDNLPKLDIKVAAPNIKTCNFEIEGTSPLVIHRFSAKAKNMMIEDMKNPKRGTKRQREPLDPERLYNEARYVSPEGWDGFNVAAVRNAFISACRLGNAKMTMAKLSIFVEADGRDATEPQYGLIRIYGERTMSEMIGRLPSGAPIPTYRPMYFPWRAKLKMRYDDDQFHMQDIANLLIRVGLQVGLCEGRNDSKNSAGMGWGCFSVL